MKKENEKNICDCGKEGKPDHVCPFSDIVHGDTTKCNCCEECEEACFLDT